MTILHGLTPRPSVKILRLPGLPEGGDLVEYIEAQQAAGLNATAIRAAIDKLAATVEEEPPIPVVPAVESYRSFPVELIPEPVQGFIRAAAAAIRT